MSEYHTQAAFNERMRVRHGPIAPVTPHAVFYHIACMNHWREIVSEQLRLCSHVGLQEVRCCILGSKAEVTDCKKIADSHGVSLIVVNSDSNLQIYEEITIKAVRDWAIDNAGAATYFHTKGVSVPRDPYRDQWRRVMAREVIGEWRRNLKLLEMADIVGMDWRLSDVRWPHFCGNFWSARCDWLSRLPTVEEHRPTQHPWGKGERWVWETWLGSKSYHHVESLGGFDKVLWQNANNFRIDVPGFSYEGEPK